MDHLVIGSGIAGLSLALRLAERGQVLVIAKGQLSQNSTSWAQGGIASAIGSHDSIDEHVQDTMAAGAGLCHREVVERVVAAGPEAIAELVNRGVEFTRGGDSATESYHLTREGGHSRRRILHADDATGREIMRALIAAVRANTNIEIREDHVALDLLTTDKYRPDFSQNSCLGAYVMDRKSQEILLVRSRFTYLCTGGHGKLYLYTSNPDSATGDGLAIGWRSGCKAANLEFMQFHPTCLFSPQAKTFLISEALRGEGAIIVNHQGEDFVREHDSRGSLAPRDIVARAIDLELKKSGQAHVFIDARGLGKARLEAAFPNIMERCREYGFSLDEAPVPVVPAAHYSCGGLVVDRHGQTNVANLFALGEVACTGFHGANRLASNSLLEAVVFARWVSDYVEKQETREHLDVDIPDWNVGTAVAADELVMLTHAWDEIRRLMWNYVGIVRSDQRLKWAFQRITTLCHALDEFYWDYRVTPELLEARNLAQVAKLTVRCAMARKESRGIHFNMDHPSGDDASPTRDTVIY